MGCHNCLRIAFVGNILQISYQFPKQMWSDVIFRLFKSYNCQNRWFSIERSMFRVCLYFSHHLTFDVQYAVNQRYVKQGAQAISHLVYRILFSRFCWLKNNLCFSDRCFNISAVES